MPLTARKLEQAAAHYAKFMHIVGIDTKNVHSAGTPARVVRMMSEMTSGLGKCDVALPLFPNNGDQLVVVCPIPFSSLCAHHHVPFLGHASVGYLPTKHITGISKFKRVIDHFAARPQTQEDLANEVADFLNDRLKPTAIYVYMQAVHGCMGARGVRTPCSNTITHAVRGPEATKPHLKQEFLDLTLHHMPSGRG